MPGPFATGVAKRVILAEETTFGVNPITGGTYLRRVSSDLTLNKDSYESQEILISQQLRDARQGFFHIHGVDAYAKHVGFRVRLVAHSGPLSNNPT